MGVYFQVEEYHLPLDLSQAIGILSKFGSSARVISGGTDLLPLRPGVKKIDTIHHLVDISKLGLDYLKKDRDHIRIGAATAINVIAASPLLEAGPYAALSDAAGANKHYSIRYTEVMAVDSDFVLAEKGDYKNLAARRWKAFRETISESRAVGGADKQWTDHGMDPFPGLRFED